MRPFGSATCPAEWKFVILQKIIRTYDPKHRAGCQEKMRPSFRAKERPRARLVGRRQ
jgi:hypothetical protein